MVQAVKKKRILFIVEAVTLAQVVRLYTLAEGLDSEAYEIHFASSEFDPIIFSGSVFNHWQIKSITKESLFRSMRFGLRPYDKQTLAQYVKEELALFDKIKPDLVVGDLRFSLPVSTAVKGIKLCSLINAYWSPYCASKTIPVPDHPIISILGEKMTEEYFPKAVQASFDYFASPVNQLRKKYGLSTVGSLKEVMTYGDAVLYPDVPELVPMNELPQHHHFLGPVLWSPKLELPARWDQIDRTRPLVYTTLGSSGRIDVMPKVLSVLSEMNLTAVVATAGRSIPQKQLPSNIMMFDYVPGDLVARQAQLVLCNGGSTTGYQALNEGVPVIGLASNLDQFLAMHAISTAGAGICLKARNFSEESLKGSILEILENPSFAAHADKISKSFDLYNSKARFNALVEKLTNG